MGSEFELTFSDRDISIENETSGQGVLSVACNAACQDLLRRDGDQYAFDVSYLYKAGRAPATCCARCFAIPWMIVTALRSAATPTACS